MANYDSQDTSLLDDALALCDHYEEIFSRTKDSSELYQLNPGRLPRSEKGLSISSELEELLQSGLFYGELSEGAFDISVEPISSLWDFTSGEKVIPTKQKIQNALSLVNYKNVKIKNGSLSFQQEGMGLDLGAIAKGQDALSLVNYKNVKIKNGSLSFQQEGMGLDLGAIAKGFISDRIKDFLMSKGVKSATINLGGNVLCIGSKPDNTPFRIGIQKPFANRNETAAIVDITDKAVISSGIYERYFEKDGKITDKAVISSGIYERYFEKDGKIYHHILDPKTGYPCETSLISVTIIADQGVNGDGLSTACFSLGLEKGMELINTLPDVQAVFITDDYKLHYSDNFEHSKP